MSNDTLFTYGSHLKALNSKGKFGGYAITFGTPDDGVDSVGDFFTSRTDFWLQGKTALPVAYGHGLDNVMKNRRLAYAEFKIDETGLWAQAQIDIHDDWLKQVFQLIKDGILSWSSAAVAHLTSRLERINSQGKKVFELENWPIGEISVLPNPADPRNAIGELKSLELPSFEETVRRSKLSEVELIREESMRIRAWVETALKAPSASDVWAQEQAKRRARHVARVEDRRVVELTMKEARKQLAKAERLAADYEKAIAGLKERKQSQVSYWPYRHFAPGA